MSDLKYIRVSNLEKLNFAMKAVRELLPDEVIDEEERAEVEKKIAAWREKLYKAING